MLKIEHDSRNEKTNFFNDRDRDQRSITHRLARHHDESELPCNSNAGETVVVLRMSNRRRVSAPSLLLNEIERHQHHQPVNAGNQESEFSEFHVDNTPLAISFKADDFLS